MVMIRYLSIRFRIELYLHIILILRRTLIIL